MMNDANPLEFDTGRSESIGVLGVQPYDLTALLKQLPSAPMTAYVSADGGLISNLRVAENMVLPATYHSKTAPEEFQEKVMQILTACRYDSEAISQFMSKQPAELSAFEKRLVAFIRSAILDPAIVIFDSLWADLTTWEFEQVIGFDAIYRSINPDIVTIYLHSGTRFPFEPVLDQTYIL
jgi:ABC-type lipoprotein export system ATPase subunit